MAAAAVLPAPVDTKRNWTPIITAPAVSTVGNDAFDPSRHLAFKETPKVYTMKEIGLPEDTGISQVAVSEPFPLFTEEAVMRMRQEVLSPEVLSNCQYSSNLAQCQLRGFANKYAPFVYDVWKSPETLAIISKVAGIDLVTEMDFEIGHINISVKSEKEKEEEIQAFNDRAQYEADEGIAGCPWEDDKPIVDWHTDSYPFVCVTMLSDCTTMIGGETALRTGNGEVMKVRGPQMGCAVVLQGRYIEHQALRALGTAERISMVTSFRPRSPKVRDDTVLTTVRPISNLSELYNQFSEYRLEILEERVRQQLKELREANSAGRKIATRKLKAFFEEQEKFLAHMNREMVDDENVMMGSIDDSHLLTKSGEATAKKADSKSKKRPRRS
ncbi:uncharacterized protein F4807DRAFT_162981 [Annulohypoxylon truncatum]|uniref:uncharacterized protein n=1 Tax=Annulohypoxylon truncatum TaxID=327061 RepID=UPI002007DC99|nr:uncharacterized protein F4807DRAFT_162981 [Annulohypoxylon truncatum]KAI1208038.1 hypothetical protein F4807DRAFT_162981 [Annulohypoxylon truncatum]